MITLGDMFGRFERTAFRREARPSYLMTDRARFDLWNAGALLPRKTADNDVDGSQPSRRRPAAKR